MEFSEVMFAIREKLENFAIFAPGGHNFDPRPSEKMAEIVSNGLLKMFRMPLSACRCDAQEPS